MRWLFSLLCILSFLSYSAQAAETPKLVVFGDSLVAGYGLDAADGYTAQLQTALTNKGLDVLVINAGVSGDTTNGGVERLDWALFDQPDAIILELGANDALRGLPLEDTESNLRLMLQKFQDLDLPVLFVGMRATPSMGQAYQQKFDAIYPKLAAEFNVSFYPFFLDGVVADLSLNQADGMHPNKKGVAKIVQAMLPAIEDLLKLVKN